MTTKTELADTILAILVNDKIGTDNKRMANLRLLDRLRGLDGFEFNRRDFNPVIADLYRRGVIGMTSYHTTAFDAGVEINGTYMHEIYRVDPLAGTCVNCAEPTKSGDICSAACGYEIAELAG